MSTEFYELPSIKVSNLCNLFYVIEEYVLNR